MSVYSEHFESPENEIEEKPNQDQISEEEHHLRMSLELHSVKDTSDSYMLYCKFNYKLLGTRRTQPVLVRKAVENRIENAFQSHEFFMTKSSLYSYLASTPLAIELWHSDKYSKDSQIGAVSMKMDQILRAPLKKTENSVLRVLDTWCEILNPELIGNLRIIVYLEDLGEKRKGAVLANNENPEDYRAVWELEIWKRTEEAKWKASLKEKEQDYIARMAEEWQENENKREIAFNKLSGEVSALENKVRSKALELMKREKSVVKMEESKRLKATEALRVMARKEEEIFSLKSKVQEIAAKGGKESKGLEATLEALKKELASSESNLRNLKRDQDFASVSKVKQEIEVLIGKNINLKKEIEYLTVNKENLKQNCEMVKNDLLRVLIEFEEEKKSWDAKERERLSFLELEIEKVRKFVV